MSPVWVAPRSDGVLAITLRGDIDFTNATGVTEAIRSAVRRERPSLILVDMAGVEFLDSSGIAVLVKAMKSARDVGADYRVLAPRPRVLDQLRMTGLTDLFPVDGLSVDALSVDGLPGDGLPGDVLPGDVLSAEARAPTGLPGDG